MENILGEGWGAILIRKDLMLCSNVGGAVGMRGGGKFSEML